MKYNCTIFIYLFLPIVNYLNPSSLRLNSTETNITAAWTGPSYLPPQYHIVYHVEINGDENYNTTTGANETEFGGLTAGKIYTVFVISVVNETILSDKINGTQWTSKKFVLKT